MTETFSSQSTDSFRQLLTLGKCNLLVTTYQAGQVVMVRPHAQGVNTHFMAFDRPMGIAKRNNELAIGGAASISTFRNLAAVGPKVGQGEQVDACYLPRKKHITGAIDIHEMGYDKFDKLWFINTKMSCLATLDNDNSFKPEWRPPFISAYDLTDRCHLNGLGFRDGVPRYVSMLGASDEPGGWRKNKISGGQIMDITTNKVLVDGLCMPHSPRWFNNALWFLSSGSGQLMRMETGKAPEVVSELPGFARGLDFIDRYAIIGLSQIRESATFAGLPLTKRVEERQSGVWVVDTTNGQIVAFLVFTGNVQEVFEIKVLPHQFAAIVDEQSPFLAQSYELSDAVLNNLAPVDPVQGMLDAASRAHVNGELKEAISLYQETLKHFPDHEQTNHQYGLCLVDSKAWSDAVIQLGKVLKSSPNNAEAMNSLGNAHAAMGDDVQAMQCFNKSIEADQQFAKAHMNKGMLLLKQKQYTEGWVEYDWRWQTPQFVPFKCDKPQWQGEDISDKILLVHSEQGNGDHIMFWRFLTELSKRCKELIYFGPENLAPLVAEIPGVSQSRIPGALSSDLFDVFVPLMSVPRYLGVTIDNIPAPEKYVTVPPQVVVSQLKAKNSTGKKIGLSWTGAFTHANNESRSIPLAELLSVTRNSDHTFYSLQMPIKADERELLKQHDVLDLEPELPGYARTAALIEQLDLVITVDTAIAHLAAALGKPTYVLLCDHADWRWHTDTELSPWYPSVKLFRKKSGQNWQSILDVVDASFK
ncbi:TIGR03032 family protein [Marinicella rhabdoformis]|uniref:TIGR03032 family protein n=1 Tax=Marinicella rhabdoformis TaxID=2580566 RepID=UPI0012AEB6B9|nr:TIGR03032 family protein [Marinicella rhabdoformis]